MKAALLISGYLRTFTVNISNIHEHIIRKFDSVDVYIHITKNETNEDKYLNPQDFNKTIKIIEDELNPKVILYENNYKLSNDPKENILLNTWLKFHKLNLIKGSNESFENKYDIVIKIRPDVNLNNIDFNQDLTNNTVYIPKDVVIDKSKLTKPDDKYLCDIIAFGSSEIMDRYFYIKTYIPELIKNYGPISETILHWYFYQYCINYKELDIKYNVILSTCNVFAICGDSGSGKSTLGNILKHYFSNSFLLECDRYHKWERNDPNWKSYTHLDPDANYITKMSDDIFNLKIKNDVYQVDYDHSNGKFIEPEKVESSDNIIVCGLHSLYGNNDHIYNLKIFMDPDPSLKYEWKICRDMEKRGYTRDQVLLEMNKRAKDYVEFVEPQKNSSDVIINFFNIDISKNEIGLRIYIKNNHDIEFIHDSLHKHEIPYRFYQNTIYRTLEFTKFKQCDLWNYNIDNSHEFYQYIIFIIINLGK